MIYKKLSSSSDVSDSLFEYKTSTSVAHLPERPPCEW